MKFKILRRNTVKHFWLVALLEFKKIVKKKKKHSEKNSLKIACDVEENTTVLKLNQLDLIIVQTGSFCLFIVKCI